MLKKNGAASRLARVRRLCLSLLVCAVFSVPSTLHLTNTEVASAQVPCALAAGGVCVVPSPIPEAGYVLDCTTGTLPVCPTALAGDPQMVVAEVGPAASDPVAAVEGAASAGLLAVPDPTSVANFYASQIPSPGVPCQTCVGITSNNWTYSYAAVEWCGPGWAGCEAWHTWLKGEVHWNGNAVWADWTDCSDTGASSGRSVQRTWCGVWNNGGGNGYHYLDLGENWNVFCCTGGNWGSQQGYWSRIDIYVGGSHNFRGGGTS